MKRFEQLFWFWYACGLVLMLVYHVPKPLAFANGFFLILYTIYAYLMQPKKPLLLAIGVALASFGIEWLGVKTGYPFGEYHYSSELGFVIFGVPFTIALAWVGILLNTALIVQSRNRIWRAIQVGLLAVGLDLILDPVAAGRGWWVWTGETEYALAGIPLTNYAAWFGTFFLFGLFLPKMRKDIRRRKKAILLYLGMVFFFACLAVKDGLIF